jgi:two-component system, cell cycle response regulator
VTMLGKLKENADLKGIPVIMLTAEAGREDVALITRLGACDCVMKPFKDAQLVEKAMRVVPLLKKAA